MEEFILPAFQHHTKKGRLQPLTNSSEWSEECCAGIYDSPAHHDVEETPQPAVLGLLLSFSWCAWCTFISIICDSPLSPCAAAAERCHDIHGSNPKPALTYFMTPEP